MAGSRLKTPKHRGSIMLGAMLVWVAQEKSVSDDASNRKFLARRLDAWTDQFLRKEKHDETWWMKNVFTKRFEGA